MDQRVGRKLLLDMESIRLVTLIATSMTKVEKRGTNAGSYTTEIARWTPKASFAT
jgi:hypothetical protein